MPFEDADEPGWGSWLDMHAARVYRGQSCRLWVFSYAKMKLGEITRRGNYAEMHRNRHSMTRARTAHGRHRHGAAPASIAHTHSTPSFSLRTASIHCHYVFSSSEPLRRDHQCVPRLFSCDEPNIVLVLMLFVPLTPQLKRRMRTWPPRTGH